MYHHKSTEEESDVKADVFWHCIECGWLLPSGPIAGHVGDGNFHCLMVVDPNDPEEMHRVHLFTERLARYGVTSHSLTNLLPIRISLLFLEDCRHPSSRSLLQG